jgi:isopenicillin N synthase-like dioxygenase
VTPPADDTLIVNLGEILQAMSGNYFVATPHRVVFNEVGHDRYSIAYFHGCSLHTKLEPLHMDEKYLKAVNSCKRHTEASNKMREQDTEDSIALVYGDQVWSYLARSYPEIMTRHYPNG